MFPLCTHVLLPILGTMKRATVLNSINPETEAVLHTYPEFSDEELEQRIKGAEKAFRNQIALPAPTRIANRANVLTHVAELLEKGADEYARLLTLEMGKPLTHSKAEVLKCALGCRYYAENGPAILAAEPVAFDPGVSAEIHYEPLGVILAVMPWNFPFWQVFRCAAPMLLSGNSVLLKHASNVPTSSLAIEKIIRTALTTHGEDPGAFSSLLLSSARVGKVITDSRVRGVTLTGSEGAGKKVAAEAGASLKKTVLELGGSDPFIVFSTANLELAIETAVKSRLLTNGQSCIAAKRFIVHTSLYDRFRDGMVERFKKLEIGSPLDSVTDLGPLATAQVRSDVHELVEDARAKGAKITLGGALPAGAGFFYPATILENIPESARIYTEEAFGPVASLYRFETTEDALRLANATPYGLGASIWTSEPTEIESITRLLESGQVFVNSMVASDPRIPFGGVKNSGFGRELGAYGIREWTNIKTVVQVL